MDSSPGWSKRANILFFFGFQAIVFAIIAEYKKPLSGKVINTGGEDGGSRVMCAIPRLSVVMGSLSLLSLLLTVVAGHVAVLYPYPANKLAVPRRALLRKTSLIVFSVIAELVSAAALATLFWTTLHAELRFLPVLQPDGTLSCPEMAKTDGMFDGGALLALGAMLMWFVCLLMSLEARADHVDRHGVDDNDDVDIKKNLNLHGDDDIDDNNGNLHDDQDGNNEEHDGRDSNNVAHAEQSMILSPSRSRSRS